MQHLSVNFERACVTVLNMYYVVKNTGLDEMKGEYSILHASYQTFLVSLVACTVGSWLSGRRKALCKLM